MKKLYWTRFLKLLSLLIPVVLFVLFVQNYLLLRLDYNTARLDGFYAEKEDSLDVVFVGSSDIFTGFSPAYAYDKYGFTSYMYAIDSNPGTLQVSCLKEILKYQDPQLIIIEVNGFLFDEQYMANEAPLRYLVESAPLSLNKLETIKNYDIEDKISCLIPFIKYHGEWKDFDKLQESYRYRTENYGNPTLLKGVTTHTSIRNQMPIYDTQNDFRTTELVDEAYTALMELIDFCKGQQLDNVLFVRFPHQHSREWQYNVYLRANKVEQIVTEQGYPFINLERETEKIGIDFLNDFYNEDHLNIHGQMKLTEYLGAMIRECYVTTPIEQTPENKAQWDLSAQYIQKFNTLMLQMCQNGTKELVWEKPELVNQLTQMLQENAS